MQTSFTHLPTDQTDLLAKFIQKIIDAIQPDKIICYGFRLSINQDWSTFFTETDFKETTYPAFDLLNIIPNEEKRNDHEIIQTVQKQGEPWKITGTCVIQKLSAVNESLENGSRFTSTVYRKGVLLYDGSNNPLTHPLQEPDTNLLQVIVIKRWERCYTQAQQFFKTATFCFENGWYEQTAFDLHQCVQHTCMALLRSFTGYRSTTHNLARLLELIENFSQEPIVIFPNITKEEKDLFSLLNKAYSEARYNEQYKAPKEKVIILIERVKLLLDTTQQLYQHKIKSLEQLQPISFPLSAPIQQAASEK